MSLWYYMGGKRKGSIRYGFKSFGNDLKVLWFILNRRNKCILLDIWIFDLWENKGIKKSNYLLAFPVQFNISAKIFCLRKKNKTKILVPFSFQVDICFSALETSNFHYEWRLHTYMKHPLVNYDSNFISLISSKSKNSFE